MLTTLAIAGSFLAVSQPAVADTAPPVTGTPETVSTDSLPTAQINGVVWDQVILGDTVYAAGSFTKARPAGAPAGTSEVTRTHLLAYTLSTGVLTSFAPTINAQVRALDVSPDGTRLYAVGDFTSVNGVTKNRIAAFDLPSGALRTSFAGSANAPVYAVTATNSTVYFGGTFSQTAGVARPGHAAAVTASTGALLPWAPLLENGRAFAMEVAPDNSKIVVAGNFTTLNGSSDPGYGQGAVDTNTGANLPWAVGSIVRNAGPTAAVYNLDSDATSVYGVTYNYAIGGGGGNLEGAFKASWSTGALEWLQDCHGDEYSVAAAAGAVYVAGHPHMCTNMGGFPETVPKTWHRALAFTLNATGTLPAGNMWGKPKPDVLHFYPNINQGTYTGQAQGPWSVAGNASYVVYAGEFTQVNNQPQQGLSRFAVKSIAPNKDAPELLESSWSPTTESYSPGTVRISIPTNSDQDNELLVYSFIRDGNTTAPVYTTSVPSAFWNRPTITYVDSGLAPDSSHSYRVSATDPFGNVSWSSTVSATAGSSGTLSDYAAGVFADSPTFYYRLGESSGDAVNWAGPTANTTQASVTQQMNAVVGTGATRNQPGAIAGDADGAMKFNNSSSNRVYTTQQVWTDDSLSVEAWFKTTTSSGKIAGFGTSSSSTDSTSVDRHLYLNGGRVVWGVYDTGARIVQSGTGFNDGKWHHAVGTLSSAGMSLFVDGKLVASRAQTILGLRYWGNLHIGGDATWAGNKDFTGDIDDVAVYKTPLSSARVLSHFQLGTGAPANAAPTASFTASATDLAASFDGTGSSDPDGTISSWAWSFGDGTTGTGATTTHSYPAAGTYTATLTVTDNSGATGTASAPVTVTAPPPPPGGTIAADTFERALASSWGTADTGGAWTTSGTTGYSVGSGTGAFTHNAGNTRRADLNTVSATDTDTSVQLSIDKAPTGSGTYAGIVVRKTSTDYYKVRARFQSTGTVSLQLMHGASTLLSNVDITGLSYTPGTPLQLRVQATGTAPTTIRARIWPAR